MPFRDDIVQFCNDLLELKEYPDAGPMGLQYIGGESVDRIATAVSVNKEVIDQAGQLGADILIVHHGTFWNNESHLLDKRIGGRLELLEKYRMSLLAYHLALDAHPEIGNNILAAKALKLKNLRSFGQIGWGGEYKKSEDHKDFDNRVFKAFGFHDFSDGPLSFYYGGNIKRVAIIVGGAYHYVVEAHRLGYDTFITGEASEPAMHIAKDLGMNLVCAGHHRTEQFGVQKLAEKLKQKFRVKTEYIQISNPV